MSITGRLGSSKWHPSGKHGCSARARRGTSYGRKNQVSVIQRRKYIVLITLYSIVTSQVEVGAETVHTANVQD